MFFRPDGFPCLDTLLMLPALLFDINSDVVSAESGQMMSSCPRTLPRMLSSVSSRTPGIPNCWAGCLCHHAWGCMTVLLKTSPSSKWISLTLTILCRACSAPSCHLFKTVTKLPVINSCSFFRFCGIYMGFCQITMCWPCTWHGVFLPVGAPARLVASSCG